MPTATRKFFTEFARRSHVLTNHLNNPFLRRDDLVYQNPGTSPERLVSSAVTVNGSVSPDPSPPSVPPAPGATLNAGSVTFNDGAVFEIDLNGHVFAQFHQLSREERGLTVDFELATQRRGSY